MPRRQVMARLPCTGGEQCPGRRLILIGEHHGGAPRVGGLQLPGMVTNDDEMHAGSPQPCLPYRPPHCGRRGCRAVQANDDPPSGQVTCHSHTPSARVTFGSYHYHRRAGRCRSRAIGPALKRPGQTGPPTTGPRPGPPGQGRRACRPSYEAAAKDLGPLKRAGNQLLDRSREPASGQEPGTGFE